MKQNGKKGTGETRSLIIGITVLLFSFAAIFAVHFSREKFSGKFEETAAEYHFIMVSKGVTDPFWQEVYSGAKAAAAECGAVVELDGPAIEDADEELSSLDRAIAARVDGIITHVTDAALAVKYIDKAEKKGIPVFAVGTDAPTSKRQSFIGINSYNLGLEWGKQVIAAADGQPAEVVMLSSRNDSNEDSDGSATAEGLMYSGVVNALKDYPEIVVRSSKVDRNDPFGTEKVIKNLLREEPGINIVLCTTADETVSAAETLITLNKVGKVRLIGYHNSREILDYIKKGVLFATVYGDAYQMGYQSVKAMVELKKTGSTNLYITTPITVITEKNVSSFLEDAELKDADAER